MTAVSGIITGGIGEGKRYIATYLSRFEEAIGVVPFPGTLNVKVERASDLDYLKNSKKYFIAGFEKDGRTFGKVDILPVELVSGSRKTNAYAVFPSVKSPCSEPNTIELISGIDLRKKLGLKNGDSVKIVSGIFPD